jgi:hypothetical protein
MPEGLEAAVAELLAADPALGVKKLVAALRQARPEWAGAGAKEVRQAKAALDAATASSAEPAVEQPAAREPVAAKPAAVAAKHPARVGAAAAGRGGGGVGGGGEPAFERAPPVQGQLRPDQPADSATPRQKVLIAKRDAMALKQVANALSLQDIVDYETYIQGLVKTMEGAKPQLERSFKMAEAKIRMARDPQRQRALTDEFEKVRRRGQIFNEDVVAINAEAARFHASDAFGQARDHVRENFDRVGDSWVKKTDRFGADDEVDFEALLEQMKAEERSR